MLFVLYILNIVDFWKVKSALLGIITYGIQYVNATLYTMKAYTTHLFKIS